MADRTRVTSLIGSTGCRHGFCRRVYRLPGRIARLFGWDLRWRQRDPVGEGHGCTWKVALERYPGRRDQKGLTELPREFAHSLAGQTGGKRTKWAAGRLFSMKTIANRDAAGYYLRQSRALPPRRTRRQQGTAAQRRTGKNSPRVGDRKGLERSVGPVQSRPTSPQLTTAGFGAVLAQVTPRPPPRHGPSGLPR
jgi:hypothetical protein